MFELELTKCTLRATLALKSCDFSELELPVRTLCATRVLKICGFQVCTTLLLKGREFKVESTESMKLCEVIRT